MNLAEYLKSKHLEYCNEIGDIVYESDWIKNVLNPKLPAGDKLSIASFNQWMNGDRTPDARNIIRLVSVFGPEVMPHVGIRFPEDLEKLVVDWDKLPQEAKRQIGEIVRKFNQETVTSKV